MDKKINFEDLPVLFIDLSLKVEQLIDKVSKLNNETEKLVWFDIDALCNYLPQKPAKQTVYEWCTKRKIPFHKVGGHKGKLTVFLKAEIDEWILNSNVKSDKIITDEAINYIKNGKKRNNK